jgi:hypothetical protein
MQISKIEVAPTRRTPMVSLDKGRIFIMGRSIPDHPGEFYITILEWLTSYIKNYRGPTTVDLGFEYINTSSTKYIFLFLKELAKIPGMSSNSKVNWYFEQGDEDMRELGLILKSVVECPFTISEVPEMSKEQYELILAGQHQQ